MKYIIALSLCISSLFSFSQVTVQLDGSKSSDSDGTIAGYIWRQVSGPVVTIINPATVKPTVSVTVPGIYVFGLIVKDNLGALSTEDMVQVTIRAANVKPKADAGSDQDLQLPTASARLIDNNKNMAWVRPKSF